MNRLKLLFIKFCNCLLIGMKFAYHEVLDNYNLEYSYCLACSWREFTILLIVPQFYLKFLKNFRYIVTVYYEKRLDNVLIYYLQAIKLLGFILEVFLEINTFVANMKIRCPESRGPKLWCYLV